ncbi:MAG: Hsp20/alpha crystallin family protein [Thermodesulfobacteriota bacterium]|nr:Hsp20/alpha crystallin family protein [Thermodesulfobacteriota bacterium]
MTIVRWDPFRNVSTLQDRINRMFNEAFTRKEFDDDASIGSWSPAVDIYNTDDALIVKAELAGIPKENVSIDVKDNILTIKGERSVDKEVKEENYYRRERSFGSFQRSFTLPAAINPDNIKAVYKDGILEIEIPKPEEKKPKQVTIDVK